MKNKKGFTLIELLVIVAIIGVLALIGLRTYSGQQQKAKNAIVKANAGTIQTLIQAKMADTNYLQETAIARVNQVMSDIGNAGGCHNPYTGGTGDFTIKKYAENLIDSNEDDRGKVGVASPNKNEFKIQGLDQDGNLFGTEMLAKK